MYSSRPQKLDLPAAYIAIQQNSIHIPEQGHGYSSYNHEYEDVHRFKDEEELKTWLRKENSPDRFSTPKRYKIYKVTEVKVDTEIKISLS